MDGFEKEKQGPPFPSEEKRINTPRPISGPAQQVPHVQAENSGTSTSPHFVAEELEFKVMSSPAHRAKGVSEPVAFLTLFVTLLLCLVRYSITHCCFCIIPYPLVVCLVDRSRELPKAKLELSFTRAN